MQLPRLYPIVDVGSLRARNLELGIFVRDLLDAGVEILQLRDKEGEPRQVLEEAAQISALIEGTPCRPVMNDRVDLALLAGWAAVHVGHTDLPPEAARRVFGERSLIVGVSTHTDEQVLAAEQGPADYIAIGPIFATQTKADAEPAVGLEGVRRARALTRKPLVAIGGIDLENAAAVMEAGADSVAVIGGLLARDNDVRSLACDFLERLR